MSCHPMNYPDEDIASEDFIHWWYQIDTDNDEMVVETELVNWFKEDDDFSWLTY